MDFSKRAAVITGGGSGIGRAVAAAMGKRGIGAVALVDLNAAVDGVADALNTEAGRSFALPFRGDTTDEAFRAQVFDRISQQHGPGSVRPVYGPQSRWRR